MGKRQEVGSKVDSDGLWRPTSNEASADIAFALHKLARDTVLSQMRELSDLFELHEGFDAAVHVAPDWLAVRLSYEQRKTIPTIGLFAPQDLTPLVALAATTCKPSFRELYGAVTSAKVTPGTFIYLGPNEAGGFDWTHMSELLISWLNQISVPAAYELNRRRILSVVPVPPAYDVQTIMRSLWAIESGSPAKQGTGFTLTSGETVTCSHVLSADSYALRANDPTRRYHLEVVSENRDLDLAIINVIGGEAGRLPAGNSDGLRVLDHVAVARFPNYRLGDSGTFAPGLVTGFRTVSGVRRILVNAPIVGGASGAPVVDAAARVIGVAATGADRMEDTHETEHQSIIPIEAVRYLTASRRGEGP